MARSFNGSTDQIDCGRSAVLEPSNFVSISCWINPSSLTPAYSGIVVNTAASHSTYAIYLKSTGKPAFYITPLASPIDVDPGATTISTGSWVQIGLSYDGSAGVGGTSFLVNYVGGVQDSSTSGGSFGPMAAWSGTSHLGLGNDLVNAGRNFGGSIADVALWNVVLSAAEFAALGKGARPYTIRPTSIIGYWPLSGLQSPEPDFSGNANNGTLTGTTNASGQPVMQFTPRWPQANFAGAAASFNPAWALGRNQFIEGFAS